MGVEEQIRNEYLEAHFLIEKLILDALDIPKKAVPSRLQAYAGYSVAKALRTQQSITLLCSQGFGEDAEILNRSLYEQVLTLRYFRLKGGEEEAAKYLDSIPHHQREILDAAKKFYPNIVEELNLKETENKLSSLTSQKPKYKLPYKINMAKDAKIEDFHNLFYSTWCNLSHSNPVNAERFLHHINGRNLIDNKAPHWPTSNFALKTAAFLLSEIYIEFCFNFNIVPSPDLKNVQDTTKFVPLPQ